jgi:hypothetical protein
MKPKWPFWAALIFAAVAAALVLAPLQAMPFGRDQALFAVGGKLLAEHGLSTADFWHVRAPGVFGFMAAVRTLVGPLESHARLVEWVWMLLACLAAGWVAYRLTRRSLLALVLAAVLLAVRFLAGGFEQTLQPAGLAALPLLTALVVWGPIGRERKLSRTLVAGLLIGVATLFSGEAIWVVIALVTSEFALAENGEGFRRANREATLLAAASIVLPVVFFVATLATTPWGALKPTLGAMIQAFSDEPRDYAIDLVVTVGLALAVWKRRDLRTTGLPLLLTILAYVLVSAVFQAPGDRLLLLGPLAVATAWAVATGLQWLAAQGLPRWLRGLALVAFSAAALLGQPWTAAVDQWRHFSHFLRGEYAEQYAGRFSDPTTDFSYANVRRAAGVLEQLDGGRASRLFVWGAEPGLYHYSGLAGATRFYTHIPILTADDPVPLQQEILDVFSFDPPQWVVVCSADERQPVLRAGRDSRALLDTAPPIRDEVLRNYEIVWQSPEYTIHRRIPHVGAPPPPIKPLM